jgi:hypothetical protein
MRQYTAIEFDSIGSKAFIASSKGSVFVFDLATWDPIQSIKVCTVSIRELVYHQTAGYSTHL